jgi:hypothetical protein
MWRPYRPCRIVVAAFRRRRAGNDSVPITTLSRHDKSADRRHGPDADHASEADRLVLARIEDRPFLAEVARALVVRAARRTVFLRLGTRASRAAAGTRAPGQTLARHVTRLPKHGELAALQRLRIALHVRRAVAEIGAACAGKPDGDTGARAVTAQAFVGAAQIRTRVTGVPDLAAGPRRGLQWIDACEAELAVCICAAVLPRRGTRHRRSLAIAHSCRRSASCAWACRCRDST